MTDPNPVIFVVDDDRSVRKSLERLISSAGLDVRCFPSATEFLSHPLPEAPCCLILDVRLPELNGLDLQDVLTRREIRTPIIFITGHGTIPMSVRAMKAGAVDFLQKPFDDETLLNLVRESIEKDRKRREDESEIEAIVNRIDFLTPRERQVFERVITGMLNKQIAADLGTSEKTIKVHRGRVMRKMRVDSVAELVHLAERVGLVPSEKPSILD